MENSGGRTAFVATDLELQITAWLEGTGESDNAFTVSARKLLDIVRALPDQNDAALDLNGEQLKIQGGQEPLQPAHPAGARFPEIADRRFAEGVSFSMPQAPLRALLASAQYAMAVQDIRYYLNGMLFSLQGQKVVPWSAPTATAWPWTRACSTPTPARTRTSSCRAKR
jgi:DNA polymerase-3 subunit beta